MFPVINSGPQPDFKHHGNTDEESCTNWDHFLKHLSAFCLSEMIRTISEHCSGHTHWIPVRWVILWPVLHFLAKSNQQHEVAKRASLDSARKLSAKSLRWLLENGYCLCLTTVSSPPANCHSTIQPKRSLLPWEAITVHQELLLTSLLSAKWLDRDMPVIPVDN